MTVGKTRAEPRVWATAIVMRYPLSHNSPEMPLIERNKPSPDIHDAQSRSRVRNEEIAGEHVARMIRMRVVHACVCGPRNLFRGKPLLIVAEWFCGASIARQATKPALRETRGQGNSATAEL